MCYSFSTPFNPGATFYETMKRHNEVKINLRLLKHISYIYSEVGEMLPYLFYSKNVLEKYYKKITK